MPIPSQTEAPGHPQSPVHMSRNIIVLTKPQSVARHPERRECKQVQGFRSGSSDGCS